jgi:hypothetical protein
VLHFLLGWKTLSKLSTTHTVLIRHVVAPAVVLATPVSLICLHFFVREKEKRKKRYGETFYLSFFYKILKKVVQLLKFMHVRIGE